MSPMRFYFLDPFDHQSRQSGPGFLAQQFPLVAHLQAIGQVDLFVAFLPLCQKFPCCFLSFVGVCQQEVAGMPFR